MKHKGRVFVQQAVDTTGVSQPEKALCDLTIDCLAAHQRNIVNVKGKGKGEVSMMHVKKAL